MVTMDSDFLALADKGAMHAGIVYANPRRKVGELIGALILVYDVLSGDEMANHLEYV